ncbi:hypothetical protein CDAR_45911 [Caerostris darwini]|uniref:Uncharacterized protein n=1 Tax=Caerostris darwini TaxID=1538125 RepID=A0AAV4M987_9ARAC|nr:hypothetical protein CDAR_45911 [Caerostris darwini]
MILMEHLKKGISKRRGYLPLQYPLLTIQKRISFLHYLPGNDFPLSQLPPLQEIIKPSFNPYAYPLPPTSVAILFPKSYVRGEWRAHDGSLF